MVWPRSGLAFVFLSERCSYFIKRRGFTTPSWRELYLVPLLDIRFYCLSSRYLTDFLRLLVLRRLPNLIQARGRLEWGTRREKYRRLPMTMKKLSRFAEAMLETARDQHRIGIIDDGDTYRKITIRHLGPEATAVAEPRRFARCESGSG